MRKLPLGLLVFSALAMSATASAQQAFATQQEAAQALVDAVTPATPDQAKLAALLGANWHDYVPVGSVERADVDAFLAHYREAHSFQATPDGKALLVVGKDPWTLPVPLAKSAKGWAFDLKAGSEEVRARRIGR